MILTIELILLVFVLHQSLITIASWFVKTKKTPYAESNTKFACLVCAHNEESVIKDIVHNLAKQNYPKELYDIIVIADNCSDHTSTVAREAGAIVWERFNDKEKSKGYALKWAFEKVDEYDAVAIFDADNLVSLNFLREMDGNIQQGSEVLQGYLDSKNPKDTWITKAYALSYWATNRIFQLARYKLKLSAQLGGTGMVIKTSVLKLHPWGTDSLTEDLEYVARYVISSHRPVTWVHEAKIYDEKPLKLKESYVQRKRWMIGHINCARKYTLPLLKSMFKAKPLMKFDVLLYLIQPSRIVLSTAMMGIFAYSLVSPVNGLRSFWMVILVYYVLPIVGLVQERKSKAIAWMASTYIFALSWVPIFFHSLISMKQKTWNKTIHTRSMGLEEMKEAV